MEGVTSSITAVTTAGVTVLGSEAPSNYHVFPRTAEIPAQVSGPTPTMAPQVGGAHPPVPAAAVADNPLKKKRGRPRKYAPDGSVTRVLSPKPISSSVPPPVIDFSSEKRGKGRPPASAIKQYQPRMGSDSFVSAGEWVSCSVGANFTPHIITVNTGEDVMMKVISFSQQGPRAICILSANGVISSVTLRQPDSSGGTLTYEGRFEILSLTGSFMPSETGGMRNRSGGMSVSLASPDGRVVGGGVAGLLVAASPVQVVVGSFLSGNQVEHKAKKQKADSVTITPASAVPLSSVDMDDTYRSSIHWSSLPPNSEMQQTDINVMLPG